MKNVIGFDLRKGVIRDYGASCRNSYLEEFWSFGHDLFLDTPETFPAGFIAGDVFDASMIVPHAPFYTPPSNAPPGLRSLTSLTPLQGQVSAMFVGAFFHLFDEAKQLQVAQQVASLLSPLPGSIIFGSHVSMLVNGMRKRFQGDEAFCHSPESWKELWDGIVLEKGMVSVETSAKLIDENPSKGMDDKLIWMSWSVTRL